MGRFTTQAQINASVERVWSALADIGTIAAWNPGVVDSYRTTEQADGIGAGRYCDLGKRQYLQEQVVRWEPHQYLTFRIVDTNLPFKAADIRFALQPNGDGTLVSVSPEYVLKFGLLGRLLDLLVVQRTYRRGMSALLQGLKKHVEGGAVVANVRPMT